MEEREAQDLSSQHWYMKYNTKREAEPEGPQRHEEELERLLAKENSFPPVSITVVQQKHKAKGTSCLFHGKPCQIHCFWIRPKHEKAEFTLRTLQVNCDYDNMSLPIC